MKANWICEKGHHYFGTRKVGTPQRCPICYNKLLVKGTNDLLSCEPELCKEWHPTKNQLSPDQVTRCNKYKYWWLCKYCGHEWKTRLDVRLLGRGCPICAYSNGKSMPEQIIFFYIKKIFFR